MLILMNYFLKISYMCKMYTGKEEGDRYSSVSHCWGTQKLLIG